SHCEISPCGEEAIVTPAVWITSAEDCSFSFQMILADSLTGGGVAVKGLYLLASNLQICYIK
ncbi:MAG: hypothetical protein PVG13_07960, partial [Thiohalophilus sp.]